MDLGLNGKTALVCGASQGMGKACALALAKEGARLAMCARRPAELAAAVAEVEAKTGSAAIAIPADLMRAADVGRVIERATAAFGGIDILIANAGGPPRGSFDDFTDEHWQTAFDLQLMSVVRLVRGVLPSMRARRWGRIVAIQSSSVKQPIPGLDLSNGIRPGVVGVLKSLAPQVAKDNILITTVLPGRIMTERFLAGAEKEGLSREQFIARESAQIPIGRVGTPEEFANMVVFLASEKASYVTGATIQVDGGLIRGLL
ncbi:MAG: SDR family oxidoreductase [Pseudomonadota bacterium]